VDTYNSQQSTKSGSGRRGGSGGSGGSNTRTTMATATANGKMTVITATTTTTAAAVAGGGDGCGRVFWSRRAVVEGHQKIAKAIWRFHPPVRCHVFDALLKHGWPSAPCHGASMVGKKIQTTPLPPPLPPLPPPPHPLFPPLQNHKGTRAKKRRHHPKNVVSSFLLLKQNHSLRVHRLWS
jgi:hypothetical protein